MPCSDETQIRPRAANGVSAASSSGEIGFESTRGEGSTFWFRMPLEPAWSASSPAPPREKDLRLLRQDLRVLVVDDQHVNRAVTQALLEELGFIADVMDSGEAALDILAMRPYDAVLLDCQMPGLDGFETCRRLRRQEVDGRRSLVIAVTADVLPEDQERWLEAGMDDYLAKPLWGADLAAVLDRHLGTVPKPTAPRGELVEERLAALKRLGNEELQADVVRAFRLQGEHDLRALRDALPEKDSKAFAAAAHALAGSSGILGGRTLAEVAAELAVLARQGDLDACAERLPVLERELQAFVEEISSCCGPATGSAEDARCAEA
jgi:CheY-like chemotaxis protein